MGRRGPEVTHLMFADDLILFGEASGEQAAVMKSCLDLFCMCSCQKVSELKSSIYFSGNVKDDVRSKVSGTLNIKEEEDLGFYLGIPLMQGRSRGKNFANVLDKIKRRLAG